MMAFSVTFLQSSHGIKKYTAKDEEKSNHDL